MTTLMIMAGGTGGHVFPALAVAQFLRAQGVGIVWLGTQKGLEARVVPAAGIEIEWIDIRGLRRKSVAGMLMLPWQMLLAMAQAVRAIRRRRPQAVLAMGGFVSGPGGIVARLLRTPLIVHEQNAVAGLTNRWLSMIATRVLSGFPEVFPSKADARHVGNPVRAEIAAVAPPAQRYAGRSGRCRVLVIGGSQGASIFNRVIPAAIHALATHERPEVWHQAGKTQWQETQRQYDALGHGSKAVAFIDDMAAAYAWADVVICRAGAMTIAELAAVGVAAVLVPYAAATDDHQSANARFLANSGAAVFIAESDFSLERVRDLLHGFANARAPLLKMANAARALARPDATATVARECLDAMQAKGRAHG